MCALPRGRRGDDGKVYRVTPPWEGRSKHFTQESEAFDLTFMQEMPVKRAGQILGESAEHSCNPVNSRRMRPAFPVFPSPDARLAYADRVRHVRQGQPAPTAQSPEGQTKRLKRHSSLQFAALRRPQRIAILHSDKVGRARHTL